jgi:hypothetical protein
MFASAVILSCAATAVLAVSSGLVDNCNALSPMFGCSNFKGKPVEKTKKKKKKKKNHHQELIFFFFFFFFFKDGDRLQCQEKGQVMEWVTKPVVDNSLFELFAGEESAKVTTFTPGKLLKVSIRTKKYNSQFNGILLYAIDASDTSADPAKVGRWEFTDTEDRFHSFCPGTVLHARCRAQAVPDHVALVAADRLHRQCQVCRPHQGRPANDGAFYFPNNVVLTPTGVAPTAFEQWYRGANNKTCDEVVPPPSTPTLRCDDAKRLATVNTAAKVESHRCAVRHVPPARCSRAAPTQGLSGDAAGNCYYAEHGRVHGRRPHHDGDDVRLRAATGGNVRAASARASARPARPAAAATPAPTTSKAGTTLRSTTTVKPPVRPTTKPAKARLARLARLARRARTRSRPSRSRPSRRSRSALQHARLPVRRQGRRRATAEAAVCAAGQRRLLPDRTAADVQLWPARLRCARPMARCDDALECSMGVKTCARKAARPVRRRPARLPVLERVHAPRRALQEGGRVMTRRACARSPSSIEERVRGRHARLPVQAGLVR